MSEKLISAETIILTRWASGSVALFKLKIAMTVVLKMTRSYLLDKDHSISCHLSKNMKNKISYCTKVLKNQSWKVNMDFQKES